VLELFRVKAQLQRLEGQNSAAEESLNDALATAHEQGAKSWELRAAVDLARLKLERGDSEAARALLQPLVTWFQASNDPAAAAASPDLQEALALLGT
jgi:ATP/maltotriose-dependent transcriptional regulator MalT